MVFVMFYTLKCLIFRLTAYKNQSLWAILCNVCILGGTTRVFPFQIHSLRLTFDFSIGPNSVPNNMEYYNNILLYGRCVYIRYIEHPVLNCLDWPIDFIRCIHIPNKWSTAGPHLIWVLLICVIGPVKQTWMVFFIILDYKAKRYTVITYNIMYRFPCYVYFVYIRLSIV